MTLIISPELEQRILDAARQRGLSPDALVAGILEEEVGSPVPERTDSDLGEPLHRTHTVGWPGHLETREDLYDEHPVYRPPRTRPTAERVAAALDQLAATDRPSREYPEDFFSRSVIYADHG